MHHASFFMCILDVAVCLLRTWRRARYAEQGALAPRGHTQLAIKAGQHAWH